MSTDKIITHGGITLNLAVVKCFKMQTNTDIGKTNVLIVEFKSSVDYVFNPETKKYDKQILNDITEIEYPDYETACAYRDEWEGIWQDYLNELE